MFYQKTMRKYTSPLRKSRSFIQVSPKKQLSSPIPARAFDFKAQRMIEDFNNKSDAKNYQNTEDTSGSNRKDSSNEDLGTIEISQFKSFKSLPQFKKHKSVPI